MSTVLLLTMALFQFHVRGVSAGMHSFFAKHARTLALKKPHLFNGTKAAFLHRRNEISAASSKNAHVYSDSEQLPSTKAFEAMAERRSLGQVSEMYTCTHVSDDDNWGCNEEVKTVEAMKEAEAKYWKDHLDGCFPGGWDAFKSGNLKVECTGDPCIISQTRSALYCTLQFLWGQAKADEYIKCSYWEALDPATFEWFKAAHHIPESCTMDTDKILVEEKLECGSDDKISRYSRRYKMVDGSKIRSCKETTNCKSLTESIDYVRCETVDPPSPPPTTTPRVVINYSGAGSSVARSWFAMLTCAAIAFLLGFS